VSPAQVVGLTGVVSVAGGHYAAYATTSDGKVWAWGSDYWGSLGDGTPCVSPGTDSCRSNVPLEVQGLTGPVAIDSGSGTTFAVKQDGTVWAWGVNAAAGNLGNGTSDSCTEFPKTQRCQATSPVQTSISGVKDVAAGGLGNFAVVPGA
jgi:alpha-tubulin suppressor-like RCC1 family protein